MKINLINFGIAREIVGGRQTPFVLEGSTVGDLRSQLIREYPRLAGLKSLYIAVNHNYAEENAVLNESDEIALIPPVAGG